jgi:glycerophosphoryl diester phosphodiesterase
MPTPEIIAHRGASGDCPENSLAAFARALELGADGIELDVHLTSDGTLVVHHDATPREAPSPALQGRPIHTLTLAELRPFRAFGEPIPTLDEVLALVGDRLVVYCELKGFGTAPQACTLLANSRWRAAVHSFDHRMIADARRLSPGLPRGVLETSYHLNPTQSLASVQGRDLWQYLEMIDQPLVDAVHSRGGRVIAWTVNTPADMARLAAMGVDGICTNHVALARMTLGT